MDFRKVQLPDLRQIKNYPDFSNIAKVMSAQGMNELVVTPRRMAFRVDGEDRLSLGNISVDLFGKIKLLNGNRWQFEGKVIGRPDDYDFNPSTHRDETAENLTALGRQMPGIPYKIFFKGEQSHDDFGTY